LLPSAWDNVVVDAFMCADVGAGAGVVVDVGVGGC